MSDSWDDYAEEWDKNEDAILYSRKAFNELAKVVDIANSTVLDFGCGTGLLSELLAPRVKEIVALDTSREMISILDSKNLPNVKTISEPLSGTSIAQYQLSKGKFDLVVASSVFGFIPEYQNILMLMKRLLAPGGMIIQWDWLSPSQDADFGLTESQIEQAYHSASLELVSFSNPFSLTSSKGTMEVLMAVAKKPS